MQAQAAALTTPQPTDRRPMDTDTTEVPSNPLQFDQPHYEQGRRDRVLCYIPFGENCEHLDDVLFRDDIVGNRTGNAYAPVTTRQPIGTLTGHVRICHVLKRSLAQDTAQDKTTWEMTERHVAVKVCFLSTMRKLRARGHREDPNLEIAAMQFIGNDTPHVTSALEVIHDVSTKSLNIVMPYYESGDLFGVIQRSRKLDGSIGMGEQQARGLFRQIMLGLRGLHHIGLCHHDISPENIMVDRGKAYIIDFGMSIRVPYSGDQRCLICPQGSFGKLPYMSPEIYRNRKPFDGQAIDVWSAGTVLWCMVTGNQSYSRPHGSDAQYCLISRDLNRLLTIWRIELSQECAHLIQGMLHRDPRLRLTIDEVLDHPWLR